MTISDYAENKVMDAIFNSTSFSVTGDPYISLHTADPAETGANEAAGGSYARQQVPFGSSSGGVVSNTSAVNWTLMPASTIVAVGVWDAVTAGNCLWTGWLSTVVRVFDVNAAALAGDTINSETHGFTTDDRVVFNSEFAGLGMPTGITAGTLYFVLASGLTADVFKISTTSGGSAVDLTAAGNGIVYKVVPKVLSLNDTFQIASGQLTFTAF